MARWNFRRNMEDGTEIQEMNETASRRKSEKLSGAVKLVNEAIQEERARLEKIVSDEEQHPIMVEGETEAGYYCQIMVDPKDVARIFLRHDYPTWKVLEEDFPDEMWNELARKVGLASVSGADL